MGRMDVALRDAKTAQHHLTEALAEVDKIRDERDELILDALEAGITRYELSKALDMSQGHLARYIPRLSRRAIPDTAAEVDSLDAFVSRVAGFPDVDAGVMIDGSASVYRGRHRQEERNEYGNTVVSLVSLFFVVNGTEVTGHRVAGAGEKSEESVRAAVDAVLAGEVSY